MTVSDATQRKILFVDDDPLVRTSFARCARAWGYLPDVAASAEEALALMNAWTYAVVVTDIHMAGMGGWVLLERISHAAPETLCLVITGDVSVPSRVRSLPVLKGVLHKPIHPESLRVVLDELFEPPAEPGPASSGPFELKPLLRALIVEDSKTDSLLLQAALQAAEISYDVRIVGTLEDAMIALETDQFDIVLSDLKLADSDNLSTVRSITSAAPHLPLVVVSGNSDESLAERAIKAGAQDYLVKGELSKTLVGRVVRHAVERKKHEVRLMHLATRDQLTGLVNRTFFRERVAAALARSERVGKRFGIISIDIADFKQVNDSLGQDAGDALLCQVAGRLARAAGNSDVVARVGGDEFALLLELREGDDARAQVLELSEACRVILQEPFELSVGFTSLRAHVGAALYPEAGRTVDAILSAADAAMSRSKVAQDDEIVLFSPEHLQESLETYRLERLLRLALTKNEFHIVLQPVVCAQETRRIRGAEVLLRWTPEGERPVSPGIFIPMLERTGQIVEVGRWVLREACSWRVRMAERGARLERISVNVSGRQLERPLFAGEVRALVEEFELEANSLELEITEAALVRQARVAHESISELRALGVRFSLDDFGTGYSSMSYLSSFPVDTLKLDQSFVQRLPADRKSNALSSAIVELGRGLGLEVVAEGVETDEQKDAVRNLGANLIQGYLTGRPMSPDAFLDLLLERREFAAP